MLPFNCCVLSAALVLTFAIGCGSSAKAVQQTKMEEKVVPLDKAQSYRILALGDSITRGSSEGLGNYRRPLQALLSRGGYQFEFVGTNTKQSDNYHGEDAEQNFAPYQPFHEGYGGFRIDQIGSENRDTDDGGVTYGGLSTTLEKANADLVLMMLGTNDLNRGYDPAGGTGYDGHTGFSANAAARMDALVTRIHGLKPSATLVLATLVPIRNEGKQAKVDGYNELLRKIVVAHRAKGEKIVLADMGAGLNNDDLSRDGVHPSTEGYNKMAQVWFDALTSEKNGEAKANN